MGDDTELLSDDTLSDASEFSSGRLSPFAQGIALEASCERMEGATDTRVGALYVARRGEDIAVSNLPSMLAMQQEHAQEELPGSLNKASLQTMPEPVTERLEQGDGVEAVEETMMHEEGAALESSMQQLFESRSAERERLGSLELDKERGLEMLKQSRQHAARNEQK